jgi:beta-glucosidase
LRCFGYGLSYTKFKYGSIKLSAESLKAGDPITVTVTVTNAGTVAGDEVVEAYVKTPEADGPRHSLVAFERVKLTPGASKQVTLKIDPRHCRASTTRETDRSSKVNIRWPWVARSRKRPRQSRRRSSL